MTTLRQQLENRAASLEQKRSEWDVELQAIADLLLPYRIVLDKSKRNSGRRLDKKILDSAPVRALNILAAGMMAGITSPSRKWFDIDTQDDKLADDRELRVWLDECQSLIESALQSSEWYPVLANGTYHDLGGFGVSAIFNDEEEGEDSVVSYESVPWGEYACDVDHTGKIDTWVRRRRMSTRQLVQKFGYDKCSKGVQRAWDNDQMGQEWLVFHMVCPNADYQPETIGPDGMRFRSYWWEAHDRRKDFLHVGGYHEFPALVPRWAVRPGDVYGRGPGWEARGDMQMLQHYVRQRTRLVDKLADPSTWVAGNVDRVSQLPGATTHIGTNAELAKIGTIHEIPPQAIAVLDEVIAKLVDAINRAFYTHLWQALIEDDRNQRPTATEVEAKRQEVMLMLGPLLENLNEGLLRPAIERLFAILARRGMLPPPPQGYEGVTIKVKFISVMHVMQQSMTLVGLRTLIGETLSLARVRADVIDNLNADAAFEELIKITGVKPTIGHSKEELAAIRQQKAQAQQQEQDTATALAATQGAKNLAGVDPVKMSELANTLSPAAAAAGGQLGSVLP